MIPSVLQELKEGRFKRTYLGHDEYAVYTRYKTESGWEVKITDGLIRLVYVNNKKVSWWYGRKIMKAIKEAYVRTTK